MANKKNFMYLMVDADPQMAGMMPKREQPPQMSTAVSAELMRMEHDIMSAMGIYQASLGDSGQEKSGRAIHARQRQGSTGSYTYTDNFGTALIHSMKIIVDLIPYVYDTERVIRIRGEDDVEMPVPINARPGAGVMQQQQFNPNMIANPRDMITRYINDLTVGKYDIRVTIGPSYATQREELSAVLGEVIKSTSPSVGMVLMELFLKVSDIPGVDKVIEEIRNMKESSGQPSHEQMIEMKKLELDGIKEMREGFEGKMDAIAKLMTAEAKEQGQQLN
ncbi:Portal protein [uncultured Thiomicrorhabdus sp.]